MSNLFYGLTPTHLLQKLGTCIYLVLTNQPHRVLQSGVHSSLSSTFHHEIIFANNLKVKYLSPYERLFWTIAELKRLQEIKQLIL